MKFYIGSGFANCDLVCWFADELKKAGWIQTYDWVRNADEEGETLEMKRNYSLLEKKAIQDSDIVIIILPAGRGSHVELGMALAYQKPVVLYSETKEAFSLENTVAFYELPEIQKIVGPKEEAIQELKKLH